MQVILANPRGFCAGVVRAIDIVEQALAKYGAPIYVQHEIVHNKYVVENLRAKGVVFVERIADIPDGARTIFSAHGVSEAVESEARGRGLPMIDATCPLVTKVHYQGIRYAKEGREVLLIGHAGHPEVEGTRGRIPGAVQLVETVEDVATLQVKDENKLAFVTQTTLSVDDTREIIAALKDRFPKIEGPDTKDICYATQNRQNAVRALAAQVDVLLVIGAKNSSNSNRLRELGEEMGVASFLIDDAQALQAYWLDGVEKIGITAGASAPEVLVEQLIDRLRQLSGDDFALELMTGEDENVYFNLPRELREAA